MPDSGIHVTVTRNVWEVIEPDPRIAEVMSVRSHLLMEIQKKIKRSGKLISHAADDLGVGESTLRSVMAGRISSLNLETLVKIGVGLGVHLVVRSDREQ